MLFGFVRTGGQTRISRYIYTLFCLKPDTKQLPNKPRPNTFHECNADPTLSCPNSRETGRDNVPHTPAGWGSRRQSLPPGPLAVDVLARGGPEGGGEGPVGAHDRPQQTGQHQHAHVAHEGVGAVVQGHQMLRDGVAHATEPEQYGLRRRETDQQDK